MSTECEGLSDRMPEVARGRAVWSRADAAHLTACAECQAEWDLVRLAATHGLGVSHRVNVGDLSSQVLRRLREAPPQPRSAFGRLRRTAWPIALAAAISLVVWGGFPRDAGTEAALGTDLAVLHELDDLTPAELEAMLELVPDPGSTGYRTLDTPESLGDLSEAELEMLLSSMED